MTIYHIYNCGCIHIKTTLDETGRKTCIEHDRSICTKRVIQCESCGAVREFSPVGGRIPIRCKTCQHKVDSKLRKKNSKKYYKNTKKKQKKLRDLKKISCPFTRNYYNKFADHNKRASCVGRDNCLMRFKDFNALPCKICKKFKEENFTNDVYATNRNYSVRSRHGDIVFI